VSKKLFFILISLLMVSSLALGACAPAPEAVEEVEEVAGDKIPLTLYYMPVTRFYYPCAVKETWTGCTCLVGVVTMVTPITS